MLTGSLCTGYGGLDMAVHEVLGGELAWVADNDPGASAILAHRFPAVPNLGDITTVDWSEVEPVDVLTAGFPCQDISCAGRRAGLREGNRSGLWLHVARAIAALRPPLVVIENVKELLSERADSDMESCPWCMGDTSAESSMRALGAVLADLAEIGFDAEWVSVPAAGAGACHLRWRVFILAWPAADAAGHQSRRTEPVACIGARDARDGSGTGHRIAAADADAGNGAELAPRRYEPGGRPARGGEVPADAERDGREGQWLNARPGARRPAPPAWGCGLARSDSTPENPDSAARHQRRQPAPGQAPGGWPRADASGSGGARAIADACGAGLEVGPVEPDRLECPAVERGCGDAAASAERGGRRGGASEPQRGPEWGIAATWHRPGAFGRYEAAVRRQERAFGRLAPAPVAPGRGGDPRLAATFTEWMMGLPEGWVTDVPGLSRNAQLKALGNGVVRQQAAMAIPLLLERAGITPPAAAEEVA